MAAGRYIQSLELMRFTDRLPKPKFRNIMYWGMEMICDGTRIIMTTMPKRMPFPLNLNRAKP